MEKLGIELSALGLGVMRLPLLDDDPGNVNEEESIRLIRYAIDNGINYIDTAYNYHKGKSETIIGQALKDGYRDKVKITTKMPVWLTNTYEDFEKYLNIQLERLNVEYIDFYLFHNLNKKYWGKLSNINVLGFLDKALEDGRIKHIGFSFHDEVNLFKEIIDAYDWDFCQIQYNYMDENYQAGTEGLKYAASKDIPVIVMEPLQGGKLAKEPPKDIKNLWNKSEVQRTPAEWGLRWVLNHSEVALVLSGMSTIDQLAENITTAETALPESLTEAEIALIGEVEQKYRSKIAINCTGCGYCLPCPSKVLIPYNIGLYNDFFMYETTEASIKMYERLEIAKEAASGCTGCGNCEAACPQGLPIIDCMKKVNQVLGKQS
jgi:predicted aldo/keto reductase-like oxidoreductase